MKTSKLKSHVSLQIIVLFYSLAAVCSKFASKYSMKSFGFWVYYGLLLFILFGYAIVWQQILKKMPLGTAYVGRSMVIVWGMLWGFFLFSENLQWNSYLGAIFVIYGSIKVVKADE